MNPGATLLGQSRTRLVSTFESIKERPFRARQLMAWMYQRHILNPEQMTDINKPLRARLKNEYSWDFLKVESRQESIDGTVKYLLECQDGETVETVWIPQEERFTVCVSSQVGCRMGCRFCRTATQGLIRNLSSAEIVAQLIHVRREFPVTNVVFMGMGEPLDNYEAVLEAIEIMNDDLAFNLSSRKITVSTSGLVPKMRTFSKESRAQLAVSLNGTTNETRYSLMPVNRRYPIEDIVAAIDDCYGDDRRRVTFEYILMKGVNDSLDDATRLAKILRGLPCKVNLIPYNQNPGLPFESPDENQVLQFQELVYKSGYAVTVRKSRGRDISAACGQLRSEFATEGGVK